MPLDPLLFCCHLCGEPLEPDQVQARCGGKCHLGIGLCSECAADVNEDKTGELQQAWFHCLALFCDWHAKHGTLEVGNEQP